MTYLQIYRELGPLATFPRVHSNSKEVSYLSWQNGYPNLSFFLWTKLRESLLLAKYFISLTAALSHFRILSIEVFFASFDKLSSSDERPFYAKYWREKIILIKISAFSLNAGKYGPEKSRYLDTFHAVQVPKLGNRVQLLRKILIIKKIDLLQITWEKFCENLD